MCKPWGLLDQGLGSLMIFCFHVSKFQMVDRGPMVLMMSHHFILEARPLGFCWAFCADKNNWDLKHRFCNDEINEC